MKTKNLYDKPYYLHRFIEHMVERSWELWKKYSERKGKDGSDLDWVKEYVIQQAKKEELLESK